MSEQPPEFRSGNSSFRKALNAVVAYFQRRMVDASGVPGWNQGTNGWRPPTRVRGANEQIPSFTIRASGSTGVTLADGKVHISAEVGALSTDITPNISGTLLSATTAPVLSLASGVNEIYMKVEMVPASEEVPGSSPTEYRVGGFSSVVGGLVTVTTTSVTQAATVNTSTGVAGDNLIASWHIGTATKTGDVIAVSRPQSRYGPITANACGPALAIFAPVYLLLDYDAA